MNLTYTYVLSLIDVTIILNVYQNLQNIPFSQLLQYWLWLNTIRYIVTCASVLQICV